MKQRKNENNYPVQFKSTKRKENLNWIKSHLKEEYQKNFNALEWERWVIDEMTQGDFTTQVELSRHFSKTFNPVTIGFDEADFWYEEFDF